MMNMNERNVTGVVCLHCGMNTVMPDSKTERRGTGEYRRTQMSIVRCTECGKEAPYLAKEIIVLSRSNVARPVA
jgi:hypothetical protein